VELGADVGDFVASFAVAVAIAVGVAAGFQEVPKVQAEAVPVGGVLAPDDAGAEGQDLEVDVVVETCCEDWEGC
jgi:hypothetical protein